MDAEFLQVKTNAGPNGVVLGMKFRNEADASNFTAILEQCTATGKHKTTCRGVYYIDNIGIFYMLTECNCCRFQLVSQL